MRNRDLTKLSGAPAATGNLSGAITATTTPSMSSFARADGTLHELWYFLGKRQIGHSALTAAYGGPKAAADRPVYFSTERAPHQHVAYRGTDGHIHEYLW